MPLRKRTFPLCDRQSFLPFTHLHVPFCILKNTSLKNYAWMVGAAYFLGCLRHLPVRLLRPYLQLPFFSSVASGCFSMPDTSFAWWGQIRLKKGDGVVPSLSRPDLPRP